MVHYARWQRTGDPMGAPRFTLEERFWSKVNKNGPVPSHRPELGPCWQWTRSTNYAGYGKFGVTRRVWDSAHRIAWTLVNGPPPEGMNVLHKCDNPSCCCPSHLFLGSLSDNTQDMLHKGRNKIGDRTHHGRFTPDQVREIRQLATRREHTQVKIGARFGVEQTTISAIVRRKTYQHVI